MYSVTSQGGCAVFYRRGWVLMVQAGCPISGGRAATDGHLCLGGWGGQEQIVRIDDVCRYSQWSGMFCRDTGQEDALSVYWNGVAG